MAKRITESDLKKFIAATRRGCDFTLAAKSIGFSRQAIYKHMKRSKKFREAVDEARACADDQVVSALFKEAIGGNVRAQIFWLKNRRRKEWSDVNEPAETPAGELTITVRYDKRGDESRERHLARRRRAEDRRRRAEDDQDDEDESA
jgi:hypothetical protein